MLLCHFLCCLQTLVAGILSCLPEQHWKGWLASGNTSPPGTLLKPALSMLISPRFHLSSFMISALWFIPSSFPNPRLVTTFTAIVEKTRKVGWEGLGNESDKWGMGKMPGLQVPGTIFLRTYVYVLQCRAEKPEVSFSTACNPIRRITLLS